MTLLCILAYLQREAMSLGLGLGLVGFRLFAEFGPYFNKAEVYFLEYEILRDLS